MYVLGLHYSVKLDDILKTCLYRAEMCLKLCEEASAKVPANTHTHTHTLATLHTVELCESLSISIF